MFSNGPAVFTLPLSFYVAVTGLLVAGLTYLSPRATKLRKVPGPTFYALTRFRLAYDAWQARSVRKVHRLHQQYGPVVRIGPNDLSFNTLSAMKAIYGVGSPFDRTDYYRLFDVYGEANIFSFASSKQHRDRKRLVSSIYTNQTVLGPTFTPLIQKKVNQFLASLENQSTTEVFTLLHYFSFDVISEFVYGPSYGGTSALSGSKQSRDLIADLLTPSRRKLTWFLLHFPVCTRWFTTRTGFLEKVLESSGLMPKKPFVFSGIRAHAWQAFHSFKEAPEEDKVTARKTTLIGRVFEARETSHLSDAEIASECADHLLAGVDTTSDSLMFLIWTLSLPQNKPCQERLRREVADVPVDDSGLPKAKDLTLLPYLNAVIRETLRLYSPIPTYEPRVCKVDTVIDGYEVPAGTIVGMSPYCLHRDESVFPSPKVFIAERWLDASGTQLVPESDSKNRQFWAFSSGARMCIGMHLANAEMLTMVAGIYRRFSTSTKQVDTSPGITSRYEVFGDESVPKMTEHECWIDFRRFKE